jgi:hypothetical protein
MHLRLEFCVGLKFMIGFINYSGGRKLSEQKEMLETDPTNPKDLIGQKKVPMGQVPPVAVAHEACAMLDGSLKYGYRNWREKQVRATVYIDACKRHLDAWLEGQEYAEDSGVHHLGHARACLGILLDAQESDKLLDDRVKGPFEKVIIKLNEWVKKRTSSA